MMRFLLFFGLSLTCLQAQTIPVKGDPAKFELATWNIKFLGDTSNEPTDEALQTRNAAKIIKDSAIDVWALQEIHPDGFAALLVALGDSYSGVISITGIYSQHLAFVYRKSAVQNVTSQTILGSQSYSFGNRTPFELTFTLPNSEIYYKIINIHAKSGGTDQADWQRRKDGATYMKQYMDSLKSTLRTNETVILLGDFNDLLEGSIKTGNLSPYKSFVDDTAGYLSLTKHNTCSFSSSLFPCSGIDHIILLKTATPQLIPNSVQVFLELKTAVPSYLSTTSDHVPVYGLFLRPTDVDVEIPQAKEVAIFPNPFQDVLQIQDFEGKYEVLNLLGQTVLSGTSTSQINTSHLPNGFYVLRLVNEEGVVMKSILKS